MLWAKRLGALVPAAFSRVDLGRRPVYFVIEAVEETSLARRQGRCGLVQDLLRSVKKMSGGWNLLCPAYNVKGFGAREAT